jgi:hypothetical protein
MPYLGTGTRGLSDAEQSFLKDVEEWAATEGGYWHIQRTRPQTLAYGLNDSPAANPDNPFVMPAIPRDPPTPNPRSVLMKARESRFRAASHISRWRRRFHPASGSSEVTPSPTGVRWRAVTTLLRWRSQSCSRPTLELSSVLGDDLIPTESVTESDVGRVGWALVIESPAS